MESRDYEKICYRTEQRDEPVALRNRKTGEIGYTYLCTFAGTTVQVKLENGELDSWDQDDCIQVNEEETQLKQ